MRAVARQLTASTFLRGAALRGRTGSCTTLRIITSYQAITLAGCLWSGAGRSLHSILSECSRPQLIPLNACRLDSVQPDLLALLGSRGLVVSCQADDGRGEGKLCQMSKARGRF